MGKPPLAKNFWVHRFSDSAGDEPSGAVELEDIQDNLVEVAHQVLRGAQELLPGDEEGARAFLRTELFEHGRLRQGWGVPGLDVRKEPVFLKNYVIALRKRWNAIPADLLAELHGKTSLEDLFSLLAKPFREAKGRYKILARMNAMSRHDVVFLPDVPDDQSFTVARIDDAMYQFEDRSGPATNYWDRDYGHLRLVRDVKTFPYASKTLPPGVFKAPYVHAIDQVKARKKVFEEFLAAQEV